MKVLVTADLHADVWQKHGSDLLSLAEPFFSDLDMLVVAGDLASDPGREWPRILDRLSRMIAPSKISIIPGNHDYWGWRLDNDSGLRAICDAAGVNFAQKHTIKIGDIRILCCTLWTDFNLLSHQNAAMTVAQSEMFDYRAINPFRNGRRPTPADTVRIFEDHVHWLEDELSSPFHGSTFVVTHHAPHPDVVGDLDRRTPAFVSDLSGLIRRHQPTGWLFGHTHRSLEASDGQTLIRNVSFGYPGEAGKCNIASLLARGLIIDGVLT